MSSFSCGLKVQSSYFCWLLDDSLQAWRLSGEDQASMFVPPHDVSTRPIGTPCFWYMYFAYSQQTAENGMTVSGQTYTRFTHRFNGPLSGTTQVSRYQKVKPIWILLKQETVSGNSISWDIHVCKSAPRSRQITTPAPHHSVFYRPDALPAAQPTASKHWRQLSTEGNKHWRRSTHT